MNQLTAEILGGRARFKQAATRAYQQRHNQALADQYRLNRKPE